MILKSNITSDFPIVQLHPIYMLDNLSNSSQRPHTSVSHGRASFERQRCVYSSAAKDPERYRKLLGVQTSKGSLQLDCNHESCHMRELQASSDKMR